MRLRCLLALTLLAFSHATTAPAAAGPPPSSSRAGREGRSLLQQRRIMGEEQPSHHENHPPLSRVIIHPPSRPITHTCRGAQLEVAAPGRIGVQEDLQSYMEAQVGWRPDEAGKKPGVCGDRSVALQCDPSGIYGSVWGQSGSLHTPPPAQTATFIAHFPTTFITEEVYGRCVFCGSFDGGISFTSRWEGALGGGGVL